MKTALKWLGGAILVILALLILAAGTLYVMGGRALSKTYDVPVQTVAIPADSASLALGDELVHSLGCTFCHGADLSGTVAADAPPFRMVASNLTRGEGGVGSRFTNEDWVRAIRGGVRPDGSGLFMMPSEVYRNLSDSDVAAIIAYVKQAEPVDNVLPATEFKPLGKIIAGVDENFRPAPEILSFVDAAHPAPAERTATAEWGAYRASTVCVACHGGDLRGGKHPDPAGPLGPDLAAAGEWSFDAFDHAMRTGERPGGVAMDEHWMPWPAFAHFSETEMKALHLHLASLQ